MRLTEKGIYLLSEQLMKSVSPLYLGKVVHEVIEVVRTVSRQTTIYKGLGECFGTSVDRTERCAGFQYRKWQRLEMLQL